MQTQELKIYGICFPLHEAPSSCYFSMLHKEIFRNNSEFACFSSTSISLQQVTSCLFFRYNNRDGVTGYEIGLLLNLIYFAYFSMSLGDLISESVQTSTTSVQIDEKDSFH